MLCPNCQTEFDANTNIPRILVFCGHTYCQKCIQQLLTPSKDSQNQEEKKTQNSLNCPECGTLNSASDGFNSFPKNLVLLQVASQQNQSHALQKQHSNKESKIKEASQKQTSEQSKSLCQIHQKKLEAFCEKDLQVLCIDCILSEQHKSHEIISVQKAVEKQKQQLYEEVSQAHKTEEKLRFIQSDIKRHINDMHSQAEKNRIELSQIYSYIRDLLLEREQVLKRQISENLVKEELDSDSKLLEISDFMNQITLLKQELLNQNSESEIEILQQARSRTQISNDVNGLKSKELVAYNINSVAQTTISLSEIKRDTELMQISKIINPTYKGPSIGQTYNQPGGNSLYSHTQSTANKLKKAGTQGSNQMNSNTNNLVLQNQASSSGTLVTMTDKIGKEESKKKTNQVTKSKVSPHRPHKKQEFPQSQNKKQGVVVLDQNKQKTTQNNQKFVKGSFNNVAQNHINLYNYNQYNLHLQSSQNNIHGQSGDNFDEALGTMGPDDVSSIYPLDTNECYFQFQENVNHMKKSGERNGSAGALNDLLDCLNKSSQDHQHDNKGSSTASETGGSHSEIITPPVQELKLKQTKSNNLDTPKSKKINPWKAVTNHNQKSLSGKKAFKKDNSTTDLEEVKHSQQKLLAKNGEGNTSYCNNGEERKVEQKRSGSLKRYNSNSFIQKESPPNKKHQLVYDEYENSDQKKDQIMNQQDAFLIANHQLASLSQERNKRKQQKLGKNQQEESPFKLDKANSKDKTKEKHQIMNLLSECTRSIEKLEFRSSTKKNQKVIDSNKSSPFKLQPMNTSKAAVCLVDLTQRDENEDEQPLRMPKEEEKDKDIVSINEEQENQAKKVPNITSQKESSPFKNNTEQTKANQEKCATSYQNSPQKVDLLKSADNLDNVMHQLSKHSENSMEISTNPFQFGQDTIMQQSVSVDTSVADPFRALCRVKEEFIFVFSGFNDQKLLSCEALDIQRGTWKEVCQISKARTKFSAVPISKSRILIFGGKQADGQRTGEIEEFNLKTNKFKTLPFKLPKPRSGFAACVKREEGKIFFCGGNSGSVLKKFDCLDLKKGKWSRWPEMLQKRDELAVALGPDGKIYAIGGYGGGSSNQATNNNQDADLSITKQSQSSNCLRTAERFDFATGQWEMLPEMNEARRALTAVALPDGIYAIGGYDGKQYLSSVEKFDLQKQQWVSVKSMNTSRCTLSAVVSNDCQYIYALGGFNGNSLDLVERYNTMTDEWDFVTPMNSKRFMHEAVCLITH